MNGTKKRIWRISVYNKILFGKLYLVSVRIRYLLKNLLKVPKLGIFCLSLFCLEELKMGLRLQAHALELGSEDW